MSGKLGRFGGTSSDYKIGIWGNDKARQFNGAKKTITSGSQTWYSETGLSVKIEAGEYVWLGVLTPTGSDGVTQVGTNSGRFLTGVFYDTAGATLPSPLAGSEGQYHANGLYAEYTPNLAPLRPTWRNPAEGSQVPVQPTWEVNLLQDASEASLDSITDVQLQIRRASDDVVVYDQVLPTTSAERAQGYFSRAPIALASATAYKARARTRDSFGVWSTEWSPDRTVTIENAPSGIPASPLGKVNAISGFNYAALYEHPTPLNADRAQVLVYNSTGSLLLYDSGEVVLSPTVADGGTITVPEWHADLAWATGYRWKIRVRDTALVWGGYSDPVSFNTNAPPNVPTNLQPSGDSYTPTRTFTASVSDPDGDQVAGAEIEIVNADTNVVLSGYPKSGIVSIADGVATFTIPEADVTLGARYKWRARATDGHPNSPGLWSDYAFYRYQNVPDVTVDVPDPVSTHAPSFTATYNHLSSLARTHQKTVLQKFSNGAWVAVYDSGWTANAGAAGSTFAVSFPANTVRNHTEYRLKVFARDTGGGEGETPYYEFTTDYEGPPALAVQLAQAVPEAAEAELGWLASSLTSQEFAGIEVRRRAADGSEDEVTLALILDPAATSFRDPFPVSGRAYYYDVRQIKNLGVEQVESEWTTSLVTVDYPGFYFVKDVEDPLNLWVKYRIWRDALRTYGSEPPESVLMPWGAKKPITLTSRARPRDGELEIRFLGDLPGQTAEEGWRRIKEIEARRRTICLLSHYPDRDKVFASMAGRADFGSYVPLTPYFRVLWRESGYSEDFYEREGIF